MRSRRLLKHERLMAVHVVSERPRGHFMTQLEARLTVEPVVNATVHTRPGRFDREVRKSLTLRRETDAEYLRHRRGDRGVVRRIRWEVRQPDRQHDPGVRLRRADQPVEEL